MHVHMFLTQMKPLKRGQKSETRRQPQPRMWRAWLILAALVASNLSSSDGAMTLCTTSSSFPSKPHDNIPVLTPRCIKSAQLGGILSSMSFCDIT